MDQLKFRENYENKSTDELLYLYSRGGLIDEAKTVLEDIIRQRGVSEDDIKYANSTVKQEQEYIQKRKDDVKRSFKRKLIFWGLLAIMVVIYKIIQGG